MAISSPTLGTLAQIMGALRSIIPSTHPSFFKTRQARNETITYLPWYMAKEALDQCAPGWDYSIKEVGSVVANLPEVRDGQGNVRRAIAIGYARVYVVGVLSIPTTEGVVQRSATGFEDFDNDSYGDPFSNASAMAFNRAAALFDLGIDLYNKDKRAAIGAGQPQQNNYGQQGGYPQQQQPQQPNYGGTPQGQPQGSGGGGNVAKHGKFKDLPLDSTSIDIGWLQYMSDPSKATNVNPADRAMYQAELARRQGGAGQQQVPPSPPASYGTPPQTQPGYSSPQPSYGAPQPGYSSPQPPYAPPAGTQGAPYAGTPGAPGAYSPPTAPVSPSNGFRSNDEIRNFFTMCSQAGSNNWEALVARSRAEFGNEPKMLTVGELGLLQLVVTKGRAKQDFLNAAHQHFAGNVNPQTWGPNELSLLAQVV